MEDFMWSGVRKRIIDRLAERQISGSEVSRQIGKNGGYLFEFIGTPKGTGRRGRRSKEEMIAAFSTDGAKPPKKDTLRPDGLEAIAEVLDCDPAYLYGLQDEPRGAPIPPRLAVYGVLAEGVAASPERHPLLGDTPIAIRAIPTYPAEIQRLYFVQDDHAKDLCLPAGSMVIAIPVEAAHSPLSAGDMVICSRRQGEMVELTVHRMNRKGRDLLVEGFDVDNPESEISGIIIFQARYRG